jgi:exonuclease VII small subunit
MNEEELKIADEKIIAFTQIKRLNKVVDQLEQRIATLERVLQSHAKCIGELREDKNE